MSSNRTDSHPTETGQVIACYGRRALVATADGAVLSCVTRARRGGAACGDLARITRTAGREGVIEAIEPRRSVLYRADARHEKLIAANVDQVLIVLAVSPAPHADFIDRCLAAAESAGVRPVMLLNKIDQAPGRDQARECLAGYRALGYACAEFSALVGIDELRPLLEARLSVLIGQSGVGKSTILNRLVPQALARVGEISSGRSTGRHTTTHTQLHRLDAQSALIDSPGMQGFGLHQLSRADLASAFVEFRPLLGRCRFNDCAHLSEPGCALEAAMGTGEISRRRFESFRRIAATVGRPVH